MSSVTSSNCEGIKEWQLDGQGPRVQGSKPHRMIKDHESVNFWDGHQSVNWPTQFFIPSTGVDILQSTWATWAYTTMGLSYTHIHTYSNTPFNSRWIINIEFENIKIMLFSSLRAFVKKSASWSSDGTYSRWIVCCWQWECVKDASIPICFVSGSFVIWIAVVLSQKWMWVHHKRHLDQPITNAADVVVSSAQSSAPALERDTVVCFFDFHAMREVPRKTQ
jgi:hypothetical protein